MMADGSLLRSGGGHGGRCRPTMFTKQVSCPLDGVDSPSWPPGPSKLTELEESPGHGPDPSFCALQRHGCRPDFLAPLSSGCDPLLAARARSGGAVMQAVRYGSDPVA
jgi:hypothetical protein